jgi:hypothetical protein
VRAEASVEKNKATLVVQALSSRADLYTPFAHNPSLCPNLPPFFAHQTSCGGNWGPGTTNGRHPKGIGKDPNELRVILIFVCKIGLAAVRSFLMKKVNFLSNNPVAAQEGRLIILIAPSVGRYVQRSTSYLACLWFYRYHKFT